MSDRLRAPEEDGAILIDPPPDRWPEMIEKAKQFQLPQARFLDLSFAEWRALARRETQALWDSSAKTSNGPWILTGHQPDLFHPGVWLKNFVLSALADRHDGVGLNLVVDNDTLRNRSIRVLVWHGAHTRPEDVGTKNVSYDSAGDEVTFDQAFVRDKTAFASFGDRVAELTEDWPEQPLVKNFWSRLSPASIGAGFAILQFSQARGGLEREWGTRNHEMCASSLDSNGAFARFVGAILCDLSRFHAIYNKCAREYRRAHQIRSSRHPVPDLAREGEWLEAPFWAGPAMLRRGRLFVSRSGDRLELRSENSTGPTLQVGRICDDFVARLSKTGFRVRTRALTTTLFARLALADVFIHGIGGALYDELADDISREFFGAAPPPFAVVSGTLKLPLPLDPPSAVGPRPRDLQWNPQRFLDKSNELVAERNRLIAESPTTRQGRRERYRALRENLDRLSPLVADQSETARRAEADSAAYSRAQAILSARDYSFVLHSEKRLRAFFEKGKAMVTS